jgi:serpin B
VDPSIVAADNQLGLNLLNTLLAGSSSNVVLSPTSIALVLQILYNGAEGSTQTTMAQTLDLGSLSVDQVNSDNAALQASLEGLNSDDTLTLANSLWGHGGASVFQSAFVQANQMYYGAALGNLDGPVGTVLGDPNAWASAETDGLITNIMPAPASKIVFMIVNAIYFKGSWSQGFDATATSAVAFTRADGSQVTAQMMVQNGSYPYLKGSNFQAVSLPYGKGRVSMLIVLPDPGVDLPSLLATLSAQQLDTLVAGQATASGHIGLPRFTTSFQRSLAPALSSLGMASVFQGGDFSGILPGALLTDVLHAADIEVDEAGTVATAVTSGVDVTAVVQPEFAMTMNRPFFYAIRDGETGALMFAGVLADPTSS